jgi:hypothetical protein
MDEVFREKVRAAAAAAWWTVVVGAAFFGVQWVVCRLVLPARPAWALSAWGPGATLETIGTVWFGALAFMKLSLWLLALGALWLTLWARPLRPRSSKS